MSNHLVVKHLYRALFRLQNRLLDESSARAVLYRVDLSGAGQNDDHRLRYYNSVLTKFFGNRKFFLPPESRPLKNLLREEFRSHAEVSSETRVDVGFMFLRKLTSILTDFQSKINYSSDHGHDRSSLAKKETEIFSLPSFEVQSEASAGTLLCAHPMLSGALRRTLVLLLEHGERGSYGVVINRPTLHTVQSAVKNLPAEFVNRFGKHKVHFGGMVRRMQFIHNISDCGGLKIPYCDEPFYAGGSLSSVMARVKHQPQDTARFRFFVGCCCWEPNQLAQEVRAGYWIIAKTKPDVLLQRLSNNNGSVSSATTKVYRNGRLALHEEEDFYSSFLSSLGKDYQGIVNIPHWMDSSSLESCEWD
eukprot:gene7623-8425_t